MRRTLQCHLITALCAIWACANVSAQLERFNERETRLFAERGDPEAQFELGRHLITGTEVAKKDEKAGAGWLRKAADQNHLPAQHVMGSLYEEGIGVSKDLAKAVEWYRKAANNGLAMAQHSLGIMYDLGKGVTKDPKEAAQWFRNAANQDFPPSQAAYASKLERGDGLDKSTNKAALWYLRAAQADYVPAMTKLANMYYTGTGVPLDYRRTSAWYRRATRAGDPWATNDLAWFLATCPDESFHDGETSLALAKAAVKLIAEETGEQRHEMLDTLAASMARTGDYLGAVLWQKKSLVLLAEDKEIDDEARAKLKEEFTARLKSYQKQEAYTEKEPKAEAGTQPLPGDTILQEEGVPDKKTKPKLKPRPGSGDVVLLSAAGSVPQL